MMLQRRVVITSLALALPAAVLSTIAVDRVRTGDLELALDRVVRSQINDQVRERCESDPGWFFTGPLVGRPRNGVFVETRPDELPPRPRTEPQPFELFAYDEAFVGSSPASARFPPEFRRALRASPDPVVAPYETDEGTGVQMALPTGWIGSPCMFFLGRLEPPPDQMRSRVFTAVGAFALFFVVGLLAAWPTVGRVRRLAHDARNSVTGGFSAIAPDTRKDELSSLTFVYNDAANELQLRKTRIDDQDEALRRFVASTDEEVAAPLAALTDRVGRLELEGSASRESVRAVLQQAHDLTHRIENLTAAARLRQIGVNPPTAPVDLSALVRRVADRLTPVAHAAGVTMRVSTPETPVRMPGDAALIERAVANIADNAIRYNRPGGTVELALATAEDGRRFRLWVADTGRGIADDEFRGLTAIRRFRGDEGRNRRPGAPGLGLAVTREIADRFGVQLDLKRPGAGGLEVEMTGATIP